MNDKLKQAKEKLNKYNQDHLLAFYDEITDDQKEILINQILTLNIEEILDLYQKSKIKNTLDEKVSPINHVEKSSLSEEDIKKYSTIGENVIKNNEFAVVTMAGGQGSRLGYKGPKGTYKLEFEPRKKSLFELMYEDIERTNNKYGIKTHWYIMTSHYNHKQTLDFFMHNSYFNYGKENITFFIQDKLPLINLEGKLILEEPYLIKEASNGNGNVFNAMLANGILEDMKKRNIKWISFGGIDNILLKNVDPLFLGITINSGLEIASKSIFKKGALEKTAVYCKKDGKPAILDYDDIDLTISESKDENGLFLFREANILSHLMSLDAVSKISKIKLPYHRAFKKNSFVNEEGMKQVPEKPNTFKFENFIFDSFKFFDDMFLLRVDPAEEFAPIKDFTGIYNPDTAKEKYDKYWSKNPS